VSIESQQDQERKKMGRPLKFDEGFRKTALERMQGCQYIAGLAQELGISRSQLYRIQRDAQWAVRAQFDRKIADFVICERGTLNVVALVELDDRTHDVKADRQRDAVTKAAGYQTIRYQSRQKPSEAEIAALFQHARAWVKP